MDGYRLYEEIGNGKHSKVYKGRKRHTLEMYAVKSVDKSHKKEVLKEVEILESMDHQNVVKLYDSYESEGLLWLVLEYCLSGDLKTMLSQDKRLPESFIRDMALELVLALQYMHSKGIIYSDLKPSNILMDEEGCMKLCDFGLARRLGDTEKISTPTNRAQSLRGTPYYMAPELFQEDGTHSYASDLWALGCVLYECYAGEPPFAHGKLSQLIKSITCTDPAPPLPDHPSTDFENLVASLLLKDPTERLQWPEICQHPFWRTKLNPVPLPLLQPGKEVNILRMITAARSNLEREKDKGDYRRPVAELELELELELENWDIELDFSENPEEDASEEEEEKEEEEDASENPGAGL